MNPSVNIIIINWNGWKDTIECLESVYQIDYPNYNVILVDNRSEDDSIQKIKEYCNGSLKVEFEHFEYKMDNKPINVFEIRKDNLKPNKEFFDLPSYNKLFLIKNDENYGFAEGNNIAIRFSLENVKSDYTLILNNDTTVEKNFLSLLIDSMNINKKIGIAGSTVLFYDTNKIQSAGAVIHWKKGTSTLLMENESPKYSNESPSNIDYVSGCALLVDNILFFEIGLLDPKYFLYWEETDFCVRAQKKGYKIINVPKSKVWHKVSSSTKRYSNTYIYFMTRNVILFMRKNAKKTDYYIFLAYFIIFKLWFNFFVYFNKNRDLNTIIYLFKGLKDGFDF